MVFLFFCNAKQSGKSASAVLNRRAAARRNGNGKRVSLHAMKVYGENGGKAPRIPDISTLFQRSAEIMYYTVNGH